jgi:hypothetical protein
VADVVVVAEGARRSGLTEDSLSVALPGDAPPRRARFAARLAAGAAGAPLLARPL